MQGPMKTVHGKRRANGVTIKELLSFPVGSRMRWQSTPSDECFGELIEKGYQAVKIKWDDDVVTIITSGMPQAQLNCISKA